VVAAEKGKRFDPRHDGRLMKEWCVVDTDLELDWLAREAMAFVGP
jgi:hypothetical protein